MNQNKLSESLLQTLFPNRNSTPVFKTYLQSIQVKNLNSGLWNLDDKKTPQHNQRNKKPMEEYQDTRCFSKKPKEPIQFEEIKSAKNNSNKDKNLFFRAETNVEKCRELKT